jgi:hypothetical protein
VFEGPEYSSGTPSSPGAAMVEFWMRKRELMQRRMIW